MKLSFFRLSILYTIVGNVDLFNLFQPIRNRHIHKTIELFISITLILFRFSVIIFKQEFTIQDIFAEYNSVLKDYNLQLVIITKTYSHLKAKTNSKGYN